MKTVIANDHGAVNLSRQVRKYLEDNKIEYTFLGTDSEESVDYPDMARAAVLEYRKGCYDFGILLCGTGIGISIAANKMKGIRCALPCDTYTAKMSRMHNNSNFIALGGRVEYKENPIDILEAFLNTEFEGGRHQRRIDKISDLEGK